MTVVVIFNIITIYMKFIEKNYKTMSTMIIFYQTIAKIIELFKNIVYNVECTKKSSCKVENNVTLCKRDQN